MNDSQTLYRQVLTYLGSSAGLLLLSFVSFPLFARMLAVSEYGILNLVVKIVTMVMIVSRLGLSHSLIRLFHEYAGSADPHARVRYYATFYWSSVILGVVAAAAFAGVVASTSGSVVSPEVGAALLFGSGLIFTTSMSQLLTAFYRAAERPRAHACAQLGVKTAAIPTILLLMVYWERSSRAFLAGTMIVEGAAVGVLTWQLLRATSLSIRFFDVRLFREMCAFGAPMIFFELFVVVLDSGDRILVERYLGSLALGYYAAAYNLATACRDMIQGPLNLALVPMFTKIWQTKGSAATAEFLGRSLTDFLMFAAVVLAGVAACSHEVVVLLGSRKYAPAAGLLPMLVAGLLLYTFTTYFNAGLYLTGRTRTMAVIMMVCAVFNLALNIVLLPRIGVMGAVYATLAAYALLAAVAAKVSRKSLPLAIPWRSAGKYALAAIAGVALARRVPLASPVPALLAKGSVVVLTYMVGLLLLESRARILLRRCVQRPWTGR